MPEMINIPLDMIADAIRLINIMKKRSKDFLVEKAAEGIAGNLQSQVDEYEAYQNEINEREKDDSE